MRFTRLHIIVDNPDAWRKLPSGGAWPEGVPVPDTGVRRVIDACDGVYCEGRELRTRILRIANWLRGRCVIFGDSVRLDEDRWTGLWVAGRYYGRRIRYTDEGHPHPFGGRYNGHIGEDFYDGPEDEWGQTEKGGRRIPDISDPRAFIDDVICHLPQEVHLDIEAYEQFDRLRLGSIAHHWDAIHARPDPRSRENWLRALPQVPRLFETAPLSELDSDVVVRLAYVADYNERHEIFSFRLPGLYLRYDLARRWQHLCGNTKATLELLFNTAIDLQGRRDFVELIRDARDREIQERIRLRKLDPHANLLLTGAVVTQTVPMINGKNPKLFLNGRHSLADSSSHNECSSKIGADFR